MKRIQGVVEKARRKHKRRTLNSKEWFVSHSNFAIIPKLSRISRPETIIEEVIQREKNLSAVKT